MRLTIIPLGPGDPNLLTLGSVQALKSAQRLILRTRRHPVADWLESEGIAFDTLDDLYDSSYDFDELNAAAKKLWQLAPAAYAVADPAWDETVAALRAICPEGGRIDTLPGVSLADQCLAALPEGRQEPGLTLLPAQEVEAAVLCPTRPLLVTELNSPILAGQVKLKLMNLYPDEQPVAFFAPGGQVKTIELCDLDRQKAYDHTACAYLPGLDYLQRQRHDIHDLIAIMARLRGFDGCPWDREQTHETLRPYLIEEAYEVAAAIDAEDPDQLADELGDSVLQAVFHADIARQHGEFEWEDITTAICQKMIRRHPHIFGDVRGLSEAELNASWEKIKRAEKGIDSAADMMADVPAALPQLIRAQKVLKKAGGQTGLEPLELDAASLGQWLLRAALTAQQQKLNAEKALEDAIAAFIQDFRTRENGNL